MRDLLKRAGVAVLVILLGMAIGIGIVLVRNATAIEQPIWEKTRWK